MDILFLSHCVPNPPDKGEKIRAWHELNALTKRHRVHLACFAKGPGELVKAYELRDRCASVYAETVAGPAALAGAAIRFALGGSVNTAFYHSSTMRRHVDSLKCLPLSATLAYSSAVVQFAPANVPLWFDMVDVDSEKWREYGETRWPRSLYSLEARRFRKLEAEYADRAECTFVTTPREQRILQQIAPKARVKYMLNGVDFEFFNPEAALPELDLRNRKYVVFVGQMDYFPNVDACRWFVTSVFGEMRAKWPGLEFLIVGRNPSRAVRELAKSPGVVITGGVADVRPYLAWAQAMIAPLRIARGVQNKVLEALSMGKRVLASAAVGSTFGADLPEGVIVCECAAEYNLRMAEIWQASGWDLRIRQSAASRFSWSKNLGPFLQELDNAAGVMASA